MSRIPAAVDDRHDGQVDFELAQVNVARLVAPIDGPQLASFLELLDPVNAAADVAPGFRWRLQDADGNATGIQAFTWGVAGAAGIIVNMSVWTDVQHSDGWGHVDV